MTPTPAGPTRRGRPVDDLLLAAIEHAHLPSLGRLLSYVERGEDLTGVLASLPDNRGAAHVIGITGPPGAGKSTLTSALVGHLREQADRIAILAVDPSSDRSGGALLGDRVRMNVHDLDPSVVIRSLGSRGQLGGLSAAVPLAVRVLESAGFDIVVIETVGVGQSEIGVVSVADTTVVVMAPGMGDAVQAEKAGLLEEADVLVVNKSDRADASSLSRDLRAMVRLTSTESDQWTPAIVKTSAVHGTGVAALTDVLLDHRAWVSGGERRDLRLRRRAAAEILAVAGAERRRAWSGRSSDQSRAYTLAVHVLAGDLSTTEAAMRVVHD